ncbi:hypothetical protein E2C01_003394 [Portunus trituberculatus]|uniref:Uncharacterized protein n=1 Tax=Portunus trituberculatus TaxID=210409 RepID=A0A5B7CQ16_PORTR|nr:hypothetical protein [Portunus trituberculatus]
MQKVALYHRCHLRDLSGPADQPSRTEVTHFIPPVAANSAVPLGDVWCGQPQDNAVVMMVEPPLLDVCGVGCGHGHAAHCIHGGAVLPPDACIHLQWGTRDTGVTCALNLVVVNDAIGGDGRPPLNVDGVGVGVQVLPALHQQVRDDTRHAVHRLASHCLGVLAAVLLLLREDVLAGSNLESVLSGRLEVGEHVVHRRYGEEQLLCVPRLWFLQEEVVASYKIACFLPGLGPSHSEGVLS